jgi:hypothetical protein
MRGLFRLAAFYGPDTIAHSYIACMTRNSYDLAPGITAVGGWTTW